MLAWFADYTSFVILVMTVGFESLRLHGHLHCPWMAGAPNARRNVIFIKNCMVVFKNHFLLFGRAIQRYSIYYGDANIST